MVPRMALLAGGVLLLTASSALAQDPAATCDRLAASPLDATRAAGVAGVAFGEISVADAEPACRAALEMSSDPRHSFQLARVLHQAGHLDEAASFYEDAASGGHADAMVSLAQVLDDITRQRSVELLEQAAAKGSINAIYNLGVFMRDHQRDGKTALRHFVDAAARGDADAAFNAGVLYDDGNMVVRNATQAERYYRQAANAGHEWAKINLAHLLIEEGRSDAERTEAIALFHAAAKDDKDINSGLQLGLLIQDGSAQEQEESERLVLAALRARDLELAKLLQQPRSSLSQRNRKALLRELQAESESDLTSKLGTYYADD